MRIGIVAEFNPLHNGHKYLIDEAKSMLKTKDDKIICVMSEFFTERGEASIVNGYLRAQEAVRCGVDVVLAMPYKVSVSFSDDFARENIKILKKCGVTHLMFGVEKSIYDFKELYEKEQDKNYSKKVKELLKKGLSYPKIQSKLLGIENNTPNFILGYSYYKAIRKYAKGIKIIPVTRRGQGLNETKLENTPFLSATAIRTNINDEKIKDYISSDMHESLLTHKNVVIEDFYSYIRYEILSKGIKGLKDIYDVTEGLETRIYKANQVSNNYFELVENIASKRYSKKKIQRILLHILTNTYKKNYRHDKTKHIKILSAKKESTKVIREINNNKFDITLYTKLKKDNEKYFLHDIQVARIYNLVAKEKDIFKFNIELL